GNSFQTCLSHLEKMLKRCEDTNLCLNWEKGHFMVKEGIVLGHKISKNGIEVDKAKVDVIAKLPHPTTVKPKTDKSSIDEPPEVELKDIPPHLEYAFLEGDDKLPVIIAKDLSNEEKIALITVLKSHKCMMAIFHDMIEKMLEVFMDDFSVFGNSFQTCLSHLEKMLKRCEDTNLKRQRSPAHMALLPTVACLSACAMLQALFKGEFLRKLSLPLRQNASTV
nr:reverse transcriptase domain-containing protein [Tanacetum cinerariifolium]